MDRSPDFSNILRVLDREKPIRPTIFEFFLNGDLYVAMANMSAQKIAEEKSKAFGEQRIKMQGFFGAGYDYACIMPEGSTSFFFPLKERHQQKTLSMNELSLIADQNGFDAYSWPDPDLCDYSVFDVLSSELPKNARFIAYGPCGVLENAMAIVGFENLCVMAMTDPDFTQKIFDAIGSRLLRYYEICLTFKSVGACIVNDDWGFKNQTMLSPDQMRRYVIPWHKKIVKAIHDANRPALLHSCGNLEAVMDDIIDDIGFDGKHSYEDAILPVEQAYDRYNKRIAIMGGIDVDFLIRSPIEDIRARASAMIKHTNGCTGWALGSGNSIPAYVPQDKYRAMVEVVTKA